MSRRDVLGSIIRCLTGERTRAPFDEPWPNEGYVVHVVI
jgi:hypothetical protein